MSHAPTAPQFKTESPGLAIMLGVIMVILGVLAMLAPLLAGIAVAVVVGVFLIAAGIAKCVFTFKVHSWSHGILGFIAGLLAILAGILLLLFPVIGLLTLTWLLAAYFIIHGVLEIAWAFRIKPRRIWGWLLANGIISLLLGLLIWLQWPFSGLWAIGLLVGINILFTGITMMIPETEEHGTTGTTGTPGMPGPAGGAV